jgi:predicted NBD/HSP70 family sugar kinase
VDRLLAQGRVAEVAKSAEARRGPKATLLQVNSDLAFTVGTDLEGTAIRACVVDCADRVLAAARRGFDARWGVVALTRAWRGVIAQAVQDAGLTSGRIAGVGVGFPGIGRRTASAPTAYEVSTYLPPGRRMDLMVSAASLGLAWPFVPANNVVWVSEYERKLGVAQGEGDLLSVLVRFGVGAAVVCNGTLLAGSGTMAGELGHLRIDPAGPRCLCGRNGCLDAFVSGRTWPAPAARQGAAWLANVQARSRHLGVALGGLLKVVHSPVVVLNGIYNDYEAAVAPALRAVLGEELEGLGLPVPKVVFGRPDEWKVSVGAALGAREAFLESFLCGGKTAGRHRGLDRPAMQET